MKEDSLFYYLKHKDQFTKNLKRKDYNDAIEEIEAEIRLAGSDGNNEIYEENPVSAVNF